MKQQDAQKNNTVPGKNNGMRQRGKNQSLSISDQERE
jgi:hypothetical protein